VEELGDYSFDFDQFVRLDEQKLSVGPLFL
jgi:hypothetical protein